MPFRIHALDQSGFAPYFAMTEAELARNHIRRLRVDAHPGFPCRITLEDAPMGSSVLLISITHLDGDSPYRSSGPVFVRENAPVAKIAPGEIPSMLRSRQLSLRAYDTAHMMIDATVTSGETLRSHLEKLFQNPATDYVHIHHASRGCYACAATRT